MTGKVLTQKDIEAADACSDVIPFPLEDLKATVARITELEKSLQKVAQMARTNGAADKSVLMRWLRELVEPVIVK